MKCPECGSSHIRKNGKMRGKQNHICVDCHGQFIDVYTISKGYSDEIKAQCLKMYVNGMGFRGIERVTGERLPFAVRPRDHSRSGGVG
jgi:transposase-like protein